jgi:hypothetical protein
MSADTFTLCPTTIMRVDEQEGKLGVVSAGHGPDEALVVFRGPEDAWAFQRTSGKYTEAEGCTVVGMDRNAVAALLDKQGLRYVAMPEGWTGDPSGRVDLFSAENFLKFLDESEPA